MFEKEAEEYGKTSTDSYKDCLVDIDDISVLDEAITEGFKDGAEFGYNKANEWHYVKDGDLPKEFDKPYLCKVYNHFEVGYFTAYKDQPWHFDEYYLDNEDVIAWKEIVLPELPKENE